VPSVLESNFLVPNASFFLALFVVLLVVGMLVGGLVWLLVRRNRHATGSDGTRNDTRAPLG
jgi:hypothetical protein